MNLVKNRENRLELFLKNIKNNIDIINKHYISISQNESNKPVDFVNNVKLLKKYINHIIKNEKKMLSIIKKQHLYLKKNKLNKLKESVKEYNIILSDTKKIHRIINNLGKKIIIVKPIVSITSSNLTEDENQNEYMLNLLEKLKNNVNKLNH
jgi:hypothetical protein